MYIFRNDGDHRGKNYKNISNRFAVCKAMDVIATLGQMRDSIAINVRSSLKFHGHDFLSEAGFAASFLQKQVLRLQVTQLVTSNKILKKLKPKTILLLLELLLELNNPLYSNHNNAFLSPRDLIDACGWQLRQPAWPLVYDEATYQKNSASNAIWGIEPNWIPY